MFCRMCCVRNSVIGKGLTVVLWKMRANGLKHADCRHVAVALESGLSWADFAWEAFGIQQASFYALAQCGGDREAVVDVLDSKIESGKFVFEDCGGTDGRQLKD